MDNNYDLEVVYLTYCVKYQIPIPLLSDIKVIFNLKKISFPACYDWSEKTPILSNNTKRFNNMFNETMSCISSNQTINNTDEICQRCLQSYVQLDSFYISLSKDSVGLDGVCFDIVDSVITFSYYCSTYILLIMSTSCWNANHETKQFR